MSSVRIRIAARLLAVAALAALTAGCFQPMYAEHADGTPGLREKLMGVEIPPVDKPNASREARIGVEIRNALAFKLYGTATGMPPTHRLGPARPSPACPMTFRANCSASPARAPSATPRTAPRRRSRKTSRPGWRRTSSPAVDRTTHPSS